MASHDADDIVPGRWIVRLRPYLTATTQQSHISRIKSMTADRSTPFQCAITHEFEFPSAMRGYSAAFEDQTKEQLEQMDEVILVEPDRLYKHCATQHDAPWGLARISTRARLPSSDPLGPYQYQYEDSASGKNTLAYVLDTGIKADHLEFEERATRGPKFVTSSNPISEEDVNGHGTHVAGTIASRSFGVAKKARVVSVKVFNDDRPEPGALTSDIISALQWVVGNARERGRKAVVNLSLGGGFSTSMNDAVAAAVRNGLIVCVAAGNEARPAENTSPASEPLAITVGGTNIQDQIVNSSNYGKMVDIFAPGYEILSTWIDSRNPTALLSGTSMASPHVAGAACCLLSDPNWTSERLNYNVISELLIRADKNKIAGLETRSRTIDALLQTSD